MSSPLPYYFSLITGGSGALLDLTIEPESPLTEQKVITLAKLVGRTQWARVFRQQRSGGATVLYDSRGGSWGPLCEEPVTTERLMGMPVVVDPNLPPDTVELRQQNEGFLAAQDKPVGKGAQ